MISYLKEEKVEDKYPRLERWYNEKDYKNYVILRISLFYAVILSLPKNIQKFKVGHLFNEMLYYQNFDKLESNKSIILYNDSMLFPKLMVHKKTKEVALFSSEYQGVILKKGQTYKVGKLLQYFYKDYYKYEFETLELGKKLILNNKK